MDILAKRSDQKRNLGPGEPVEVAKALARVPYWNNDESFEQYARYPAIGGNPAAIALIRKFLKNNDLPYKGEIVVTNGAKQGLSAALYALRHRIGGHGPGRDTLTHWGPYWPTLKSICELAGLDLKTGEGTGVFGIVTSPNNPDGRQYKDAWGHNHFGMIWDAAYASPAYGWNGAWVPSHAKVFSMAKLFGVPGLRVGWVLFNDPVHAYYARAYVEVTTSGVNNKAQSQDAARILTYFGDQPREYKRFCADVERRLGANRALLSNALHEYVDNAGTEDGMYFWAFVKRGYWTRFKNALKTADIGFVPGAACGAPWNNFYRFNLAQDFEVVREAAAVLANIMGKK